LQFYRNLRIRLLGKFSILWRLFMVEKLGCMPVRGQVLNLEF
jgi:hypothetical protein